MSINVLLMPFFLQLGMRLDPMQAGFLVVPTPFAMALLAPLTGWMSDRFIPERLCSLGLIINAVAFFFLSFLSVETTSVTSHFMAQCPRFWHGAFSDAKQQLIDELPSTPTLESDRLSCRLSAAWATRLEQRWRRPSSAVNS
jgi:MFS family permease